MTTPAPRQARLCDVCGGYDDHPRHVTSVAPGAEGTVPDNAFLDALPAGVSARAIAEVMDPSTFVRHMDCCASRGCSTCLEVTTATGGAHGDALTAAIESGVVNDLGSAAAPTQEA